MVRFGQHQQAGLAFRMAPGSRPAEIEDICLLARKYPQRGGCGRIRWAFGGGAAAKLFGERFEATSLETNRPRILHEKTIYTRICKDLDACVLSAENPFPGRKRVPVHFGNGLNEVAPFFKRFISADGLHLESARGLFFYSPPPSPEDLVSVNVGGLPILCVSPEFFCASSLKAVMEGHESSIIDFKRMMHDFTDFDYSRYERHVRQMPVFEALTMGEVRSITGALRNNSDGIREISLFAIKKYYHGNFLAGEALSSMGTRTLRLLLNGIGFLQKPCMGDLMRLRPTGLYDTSFWEAVFLPAHMPANSLRAILSRAREAGNEETRVNNLLALASALGHLESVHGILAGRFGGSVALDHRAKKMRRAIISNMQGDFNHLHPLRNTYRGALHIAERFAAGEGDFAISFFMDHLPKLIASLARDAKKIIPLGL